MEMGNHVFICYDREDEEFVLKLVDSLKKRGVPVWLDQWDIPSGADWDLTIDNALYDCSQFLIVLSTKSVESLEVRSELRTALDEKKPIVPILYQSCRIPRQLRLIQRADFTSCSPNNIAALDQVLRALGIGEDADAAKKPREKEISVKKEKMNSPISQKSNQEDEKDWNGKGNIFYYQKKYDEAIKCYDKAIELDPKYVYPWANKGNVLYYQKKNEEAIRCDDKAIELDPKFAYPWNSKGLVLYDQKKYEEAIRCYDKAIELDPKYAAPWNNKGRFLYDQKKYDEAIRCYDKAIELDPK
jgi:tetratricopeptide (TPR) repeat protein